MRILIIVNYYPPNYWGDLQLQCKQMVDYFLSKKNEVYILTGNYGVLKNAGIKLKSGEVIRKLRYVNYDNANSYERLKVDRYNFKITTKIAKETMPDIVFLWDMNGISIAPIFAIQKLKIPKIFEISNLWIDSYIYPDAFARAKRLMKKIIPLMVSGRINFNPSIVNSQEINLQLKHRYGLADGYYVPIGVKIPQNVKCSERIDKIRIMSCGRIINSKNILELVKSFKKIREENIDFEYNLYGKMETSFVLEMKKEIRLNRLEGSIHLHGYTKNIRSAYENNDIFLLSQTPEIGVVPLLLEAMANKKLVLAPNIPEVRTIITDMTDGILYKENFPEKIALINSNKMLIKKFAENGYNKVLENHKIEDIQEKIETILYEEMKKQKVN